MQKTQQLFPAGATLRLLAALALIAAIAAIGFASNARADFGAAGPADVIEAVKADLAEREGVHPDKIDVLRVDGVTWRDGRTGDEVREDGRGLFVRGRLATGVTRAREVRELMKTGALDGLSIEEYCTNVSKAIPAMMRYYERYDPDVVLAYNDLAKEAEAFGCRVKYSDYVVPSIDRHVLQDDKTLLARLTMPDPYKTARLPGFLEQCEALVFNSPQFGDYVQSQNASGVRRRRRQ
jgi:hypothetical protein